MSLLRFIIENELLYILLTNITNKGGLVKFNIFGQLFLRTGINLSQIFSNTESFLIYVEIIITLLDITVQPEPLNKHQAVI